jgi:DNA mismatch repair protein MutL
MGFRGEALSSIASIAQARIVSRRHDEDAGYEIRAEGGEIGDVRACGAPPGTQVEVRNLFYNVPVRRKFMKTPATEMAHVTEAVTRLALANPTVAFVLTHNGRKVFNLPPAEDRAQRLGEFFGREIADNIIPLQERYPEVEIEGYLLPPSVDRSNTTMQYTYVNRRYVREKTLMHAIGEAYGTPDEGAPPRLLSVPHHRSCRYRCQRPSDQGRGQVSQERGHSRPRPQGNA